MICNVGFAASFAMHDKIGTIMPEIGPNRLPRPQTPQEKLTALKKRRKTVGGLMQAGGGVFGNNFFKLFQRTENLDIEIKELQNSITPDQGHGVVGQGTLESSRGPEERRK